jgi:hypothetical protein
LFASSVTEDSWSSFDIDHWRGRIEKWTSQFTELLSHHFGVQ